MLTQRAPVLARFTRSDATRLAVAATSLVLALTAILAGASGYMLFDVATLVAQPSLQPEPAAPQPVVPHRPPPVADHRGAMRHGARCAAPGRPARA